MRTADSPEPGKAPDTDRSVLTEVATRFYLRDESKVRIAKDLEVSRFKVARLLREARERGIVTITVRNPSGAEERLATALGAHLHLEEVRLVAEHPDIEVEREALGTSGAQFLTDHIREGYRVGFSWGRTLLPIANHLGALPRAEFVQLTGVVGNDPSQSPIAILSRIPASSGSTAKALIAPLICASSSSAASQRSEPAVAEVLGLYNHLDMAFLSVGSWNPRVTQLAQHISESEARHLDDVGAVADFSGLFFDAQGRYVDTPLNGSRISITLDQLRATPTVVAIAGGLDKVRAIHAMCASGLPTCLVTTTEVAKALLEHPKIQHTPYGR